MASGKIGQHFQANDRIKMDRTTNQELDGAHGTILGKSFDDGVVCFHIILLDKPKSSGERAITLIESCIDRLSNH